MTGCLQEPVWELGVTDTLYYIYLSCDTSHEAYSIAINIFNYYTSLFKGALGVCRGNNVYFFSTYLIVLGKDVTFPLITKFKTNRYLNYLSVNRIPN